MKNDLFISCEIWTEAKKVSEIIHHVCKKIDAKNYDISRYTDNIESIGIIINCFPNELMVDGWGNCTVTGSNAIIGHINPIRYRSYYYDNETGYYYLNSRYYDPEVGRFINSDAYVSTGQGVLGHNMFAYCQNNPITYLDSNGDRMVRADLGVASPKKSSDYKIARVKKSDSKFVSDFKNFDLFNADEQKVLEAEYFSFYKGHLVLWNDVFNRSGSFGIIFMANVNKADADVIDIIKHEYGHTLQLHELGIIDYMLCIFIPSWQDWGTGLYYNKPWELSASVNGDAKGLQKYAENEHYKFANEYMELARSVGVFSWFYIK